VFPLNLYAHVRFLLMHSAHETAGAARTRSSLRPLTFWGVRNLQTSGASCRENTDAYLFVIARLDRATQYSRAPMMSKNALEYSITRFRG
jgi:hypothetical protein